MVGGAFQTSREIFNNPIWLDVTKFRIFFYIYGNAVFAENGTTVAGVHLKRGQFLRSYRNLADDLQYLENRKVKQYSISNVKKKIDELVKENRLEVEMSEWGTLFTVVNYQQYQDFGFYRSEIKNEKENNDKNNKDEKPAAAVPALPDPLVSQSVKFFTNNFGQFAPYIIDKVLAWETDLNSELVIAAMKIALNRKVVNFGYVEGILKEWESNQIKTLDQARVFETEKWAKKDNNNKNRGSGSYVGKRNTREEKLPKWMDGSGPNPYPVPESGPVDERSAEERKRELEEFLNNL